MLFHYFFTSNTAIEMLCFLMAVICLLKDKNRVWKYFGFYLLIVCLAELSAIYLRRFLHHNNQWPYNISMIFEAGFISLMFNNLFNYYFNSKKYIIGGLLLLFIVYIIDIRIHGFMFFNYNTNNIMSVLFSLYALCYFYLLLKDDSYVDLKFSADFWWVMGVLLFYFGSTAIDLYWGKDESQAKQILSSYILKVLIILLYGCWSYSFICRKWLSSIPKA